MDDVMILDKIVEDKLLVVVGWMFNFCFIIGIGKYEIYV